MGNNMKYKKILMCTTLIYSFGIYAIAPLTPNTNPCQAIRMQCKNNEISSEECIQQLKQCYEQNAQQRQQQLAPMNGTQEKPAIPTTPASPAAPVNPHPAWHYGN
jgi:hypothetical protein